MHWVLINHVIFIENRGLLTLNRLDPNRLIIARYRDRTVSVTKLSSQFSHPNRTVDLLILARYRDHSVTVPSLTVLFLLPFTG